MRQPYQSVTNGPVAQLSFTSPTYESFFLADTDLDMIISQEAPHSKETCELDIKGRIRLEDEAKEKTVNIVANRTSYFLITYFQNCFGCGSTNASQRVAFVPEEGKHYTVEYQMKYGMYKVLVYEGMPGQKVADVNLSPWYRCQ